MNHHHIHSFVSSSAYGSSKIVNVVPSVVGLPLLCLLPIDGVRTLGRPNERTLAAACYQSNHLNEQALQPTALAAAS